MSDQPLIVNERGGMLEPWRTGDKESSNPGSSLVEHGEPGVADREATTAFDSIDSRSLPYRARTVILQ